MPNAIVLLSGGLDSTTTLAMAKADGYSPSAITFQYGQRHSVEINAARRISESFEVVNHLIVDIDLRMVGKSALTDHIDVPKDRSFDEMNDGIPVTYVPARNTIFLSFALAWAEVLNAFDIFIGVNAMDYAGYPDCRPEYIAAYEAMANVATKAVIESGNKYRIHTPVISLAKSEIIRTGLDLGVDYSLTSSCYDPSPAGVACGACDACQLRLQGFADNDLDDPVEYRVKERIAT